MPLDQLLIGEQSRQRLIVPADAGDRPWQVVDVEAQVLAASQRPIQQIAAAIQRGDDLGAQASDANPRGVADLHVAEQRIAAAGAEQSADGERHLAVGGLVG